MATSGKTPSKPSTRKRSAREDAEQALPPAHAPDGSALPQVEAQTEGPHPAAAAKKPSRRKRAAAAEAKDAVEPVVDATADTDAPRAAQAEADTESTDDTASLGLPGTVIAEPGGSLLEAVTGARVGVPETPTVLAAVDTPLPGSGHRSVSDF